MVLIPFEDPGNLLQGGSEANAEYWKYGKDAIVTLKSTNLHPLLQSLANNDDVLYLLGHCAPGFDGLCNRERVSEGTKISVVGVIQILSKSLSPNFAGHIKIFACEAALPGSNNTPSFAGLLAIEVGKAFPVCHVHAYKKKLRMGYFGRNMGDPEHKWTSTTPLKRASSERAEFDLKTGRPL